uniref:Transposase n=1 Tax=Capsaspora owczarzaki TaxID=192875 RepID=W4P252_9EUKA|nr:TPA: transposase [Capsaspora owczarzaki]
MVWKAPGSTPGWTLRGFDSASADVDDSDMYYDDMGFSNMDTNDMQHPDAFVSDRWLDLIDLDESDSSDDDDDDDDDDESEAESEDLINEQLAIDVVDELRAYAFAMAQDQAEKDTDSAAPNTEADEKTVVTGMRAHGLNDEQEQKLNELFDDHFRATAIPATPYYFQQALVRDSMVGQRTTPEPELNACERIASLQRKYADYATAVWYHTGCRCHPTVQQALSMCKLCPCGNVTYTCRASVWILDEAPSTRQQDKLECDSNPRCTTLVSARIFVYFPLKPQLTKLFEDPELVKGLIDRYGDLNDATHVDRLFREWPAVFQESAGLPQKTHPLQGEHFQKSSRLDFLHESPWNLSLCLFYDGFQAFNSSSVQMHTVCVRVLNLNTTLASQAHCVWVSSLIDGPELANLDQLMAPLIKEVNELSSRGVDLRNAFTETAVRVKAQIQLLSMDSPARAKVLHIMGHSAQLGCNYCPRKAGPCECGHHRNWGNLTATPYANYDYIDHSQRKPDGGASCLRGLTNFPDNGNVERSMCSLDTLHSVLLGSCKRLLSNTINKILTDPRAKQKKLAKLDASLKETTWPSFAMRVPRKVSTQHGLYTGEEILNFVLVCARWIFADIAGLPGYHLMWLDMADIVFICVTKAIDISRIPTIELVIQRYIESATAANGPCGMPITTHHLTHIAWACRQHGPPAHVSTMVFERKVNELCRQIPPGTQNDILTRFVNKVINDSPSQRSSTAGCGMVLPLVHVGNCWDQHRSHM